MIVELCYATKDMPKDKIIVVRKLTVKAARKLFLEMNKDDITKAYLRKFEDWHYRIVERYEVSP